MRIPIADDSHLVRRGVTGIPATEATWEVSAEASDASETSGRRGRSGPT